MPTDTPTAPSTEVVVVDHSTGEVVDVTSAETDRLAAYIDTCAQLRGDLTDSESIVLDELLRRLDRRGQWTLRVGDPQTIQYEIKAPSPTAGTTTYDVDVLRDGLRALMAADVVDDEAAAGALARTVTITARVPMDADLDDLRATIDGGLTAIAGVPVSDVDVATTEKAVAAGVGRLEKIGGAAAQLAAKCKGTAPVGSRRPKVTAKRRES